MPHLSLELAPKRKNYLPAILSLGAALVAVAWCLVTREQLLTAMEDHQTQLTKVERQLRLQQPAIRMSSDDPRAVQEVQHIATALTLPWTEVFDSLQHITPATINLSKIQPNLLTGQIVIQGYAKDYQAFWDYLALVEKTEHWHHTQPISQEKSNAMPDKPLIFQLSAQWSSP